MAIPENYENLSQWWNSVVSKQSVMNGRFEVFRNFWDNLTSAQQAGIKQHASDSIDATIAELLLIQAHINGT